MSPDQRPHRRAVLVPDVAVHGRRGVRRMLFPQLIIVPGLAFFAATATNDVVRWILVIAVVVGVVSLVATATALIRARGGQREIALPGDPDGPGDGPRA